MGKTLYWTPTYVLHDPSGTEYRVAPAQVQNSSLLELIPSLTGYFRPSWTPSTRLRRFDRLLGSKKSELCLSGTAPACLSPRPLFSGPGPKSREGRCASVFYEQLALAAAVIAAAGESGLSPVRENALPRWGEPPPLFFFSSYTYCWERRQQQSLGSAPSQLLRRQLCRSFPQPGNWRRLPAPNRLFSPDRLFPPHPCTDPPPHGLARVEDDEQETRVTLSGDVGPLACGCVL